jgi:repressor LexA
MTIGERIKQLRINKGMTQEELGSKIGVQKQAIYKYEQGLVVNLKRDVIGKLSKALDVSPSYLMGFADDDKANKIPAGFEPLPKMVKIPLIGGIACGTPILAEQNIEDYVNCPEACEATFALRCHGDSMINANINDGDVVFIHKQPEVENGQIAAVQIDDGDCYNATLKRFYRSGDTVTLMAENPSVAPMVFTRDNINRIHIAGRAVYCLSRIK